MHRKRRRDRLGRLHLGPLRVLSRERPIFGSGPYVIALGADYKHPAHVATSAIIADALALAIDTIPIAPDIARALATDFANDLTTTDADTATARTGTDTDVAIGPDSITIPDDNTVVTIALIVAIAIAIAIVSTIAIANAHAVDPFAVGPLGPLALARRLTDASDTTTGPTRAHHRHRRHYLGTVWLRRVACTHAGRPSTYDST